MHLGVLGLVLAALPVQRDPALEARFSQAVRDPAAVVPLILEASRALQRAEGREAVLLADTLEPFCRRAFFTPEILPGMERLGLRLHRVASGEVPERIARRHRIGSGLIERLNAGYDARRLRAGQDLKVLDLSDEGLEIAVSLSAYRLSAWRRVEGGERVLLLCVPVGLGSPATPTPAGRTAITSRVLDPEWTDPDTRQVYAPDDPRNVLGGYWIALDAAGLGRSGIGLHGFTGDVPSNWIELPASRGCVRMLQGDVDRVFHLALEGTPVSILP